MPIETIEEVYKAIEEGKVDLIDEFFRSQFYSSQINYLQEAAKKGELVIVNSLLKIPEVRDSAGASSNLALRNAGIKGHLNVVERLLAIKDVFEDENALNATLNGAAGMGHLAVVQRLYNIPAVQRIQAERDYPALRHAAMFNRPEIVQYFLNFPEIVQNEAAKNYPGVEEAASKGHIESMDLFLNKIGQPELSKVGAIVLAAAAENGHLELVEHLLQIPEVKSVAAANDNEALRNAASNGHLELVERLLQIPEVKSVAAANDNEALRNAASNGHSEVVALLLKEDPVKNDITALNNRALRHAAYNEHYAVVDRLLQEKDVVDSLATYAYEILKEAIDHGHLAIVDRLLKEPNVLQALVADPDHRLFQMAVEKWNKQFHQTGQGDWAIYGNPDEKKLRLSFSFLAAYNRAGLLNAPNIRIISFSWQDTDSIFETLSDRFLKDPNTNLLEAAIVNDHLFALEYLFTTPEYSDDLRSALVFAIKNPHKRIFEYLLKKPKAVNLALDLLVNSDIAQALETTKRTNLIVKVLRAGADPNLRVGKRNHPIIVEMEQGEEAWRFRGLDPKDPDGGFPLIIYTAANGYDALIKHLIQDPNVDLNATYGKTNALFWAEKKGHKTIFKLLNDAMEQRERKSMETFAAQHFSSGDNRDSAEDKAGVEEKEREDVVRSEAEQQAASSRHRRHSLGPAGARAAEARAAGSAAAPAEVGTARAARSAAAPADSSEQEPQQKMPLHSRRLSEDKERRESLDVPEHGVGDKKKEKPSKKG